MVGSVLVERMLAEKDFEQDFEPTFFTTSNVGGQGPEVGKDAPPLVDAYRYHQIHITHLLPSLLSISKRGQLMPLLCMWKG